MPKPTLDLRELSREIRDALIGDGLSGRELIDSAEGIESDGADILMTFEGTVVRLTLEEEGG